MPPKHRRPNPRFQQQPVYGRRARGDQRQQPQQRPRFQPRPRPQPRPQARPPQPVQRREPVAPMDAAPADVIEGRNPVAEALRAGRAINKILLAQDIQRHGTIAEILHLAREQSIPVEFVDPRGIRRLSQTDHHQGIVAMAAAKEYVDVDDLLAVAKARNEPPLLLLLDGIEDPHNLGAILRTADAAGFHGAIIPTRRAVGLTAAVARASAGAIEYVPVARVVNLSNAMHELSEKGVWTIGVDMSATSDYTQADYKMPVALVIGAEGKGISRLVQERCDTLVRIPMHGRIASLNASVAAALVMYEARRQRGKTGEPHGNANG